MPQEIFPSSYVCDCGLQSDHFERTIWDLKELSMKRPQALIAEDDAHEIIFEKGEFIAMWCPLEERELPADPIGGRA
jgi:hypothetical protein